MGTGKHKEEALYFIQRIERMALVPVIRLGTREAATCFQDNLGEALRATGVGTSSGGEWE